MDVKKLMLLIGALVIAAVTAVTAMWAWARRAVNFQAFPSRFWTTRASNAASPRATRSGAIVTSEPWRAARASWRRDVQRDADTRLLGAVGLDSPEDSGPPG